MQEQKSVLKWLWIPPVFMLIGLLGASWFLPDFLEWYANPFLTDAVSCTPVVRWTVRKMLWLQVGASVLGFLAGALFLYRVYIIKQRSIKKV